MKQLYCIADDLQTTKQIAKDLQAVGIGPSHFHVWSHNDAGLVKHNIHSINPVQQRDIIHSGEQGAILGFLGGLILLVGLLLFNPFETRIGLGIAFAAMVLVTMFGAWVGGFVGINHDNYKIAQFREKIDSGKYLLIVTVQVNRIREVMDILEAYRESADIEGMGDTAIHPMDHFPFQDLKISNSH